MTDELTYRDEAQGRTLRREEDLLRTEPRQPEAVDAEALLSSERREELRHRWLEIQSLFVDEPQTAVTNAEDLVRETLSSLSDRFEQSKHLHREAPEGQSSTESLRRTLQSYRSFFERLVAL